MARATLRRLAVLSLPALALAACSLAGDVTPPPGFVPQGNQAGSPPATLPTQPAASGPVAQAPSGSANTSAVNPPSTRPSAAEGSLIYAEHCSPCHGATGNADGPMAAQVPSGNVPKFAVPDLARAASPQAWYAVVTQGRLDKFMPPFSDKLSDQERWNAVAFLYTLSTPQTQIDAGKSVYAANCARCHGADGKGDGPEAGGAQLRDFTDAVQAAAFSPGQLFDAVTTGAGIDGHSFAGPLSTDQRWAVVDYLRAFAYDYFAPGSPLPVKTGTVVGQVVNGTNGSPTPTDISVNLIGFEQSTGVMTTLTTTVDAQGAFQFDQVPYQSGQQFVLAANYNGISYHSDVVGFQSGQDRLEATVRVYETTGDAGTVRIDRIHTFVLFENPGEVTIGQLYIISNPGDRTFLPDNGRTVAFAVPSGASGLTVQDGQEGVTFFRTDVGFVDTVPVLPGEGTSQVLYSYQLPYDGELKFEQKVLYPAASVNVMVGDMNVQLNGDQFARAESQDVQGTPFQNYSRASLQAGETLAFDLSGKAAAAAAASTPATLSATNPTSVAIGLGVLAAVMLGIGVWWWRRSPRLSGKGVASRDDLLQAIAELDDEYETGKVTEAEYEKERAWLKSQLRKVWTPESGD